MFLGEEPYSSLQYAALWPSACVAASAGWWLAQVPGRSIEPESCVQMRDTVYPIVVLASVTQVWLFLEPGVLFVCALVC